MTGEIPSWWAFALLALAAWRTFRLLASDSILDGPRARLGSGARAFVECVFCFGFWIALVWWLAWQAWPHGTLVVSTPLALSAVLALIEVHTDDE